MFEHCVTEFILSLLSLLGIDDKPTYTRSKIANKAEEIQNLVTAADYLSADYITGKVLEVMGDIDKVEEVKAQREAEEARRYAAGQSDEDDGENGDNFDNGGEV